MTSPGYRSSRTGAFRTRSERLSTSGDDVVEGSSATLSVAHGTAFDPASFAVDVGTFVCCSALSETTLKSAGDGVNISRVAIRCCRFRSMSRPSSDNASYDQGLLRHTTFAQTGYLPRRGSITRRLDVTPSQISYDREVATLRCTSHIDMAGVIGSFCQTLARMATFHSQEVTIDMQAWRGRVLSSIGCLTEDSLHDLHAILHNTVRLWIVRAGHLAFDAPLFGELLELRT